MARAKTQGNGRADRLEEALANFMTSQTALNQMMNQSQAALNAQLAEASARHIEYERLNRETVAHIQERMQHIERILVEHSRILEEHGRILAALPDAVRDRMGFRPST